MRISDWSSDVCSSDLAFYFVSAGTVKIYRLTPDGQEKVFDVTIDRATFTDMRQGGITVTDNPLDVAIQGNGWLQAETPEGARYTRDGRLFVDNAGLLVGVGGNPILDEGGAPIMIPDRSAEHTSELQSLMRISYAVFCLQKKN